MDDLAQLAELIKTRNWVDGYISTLANCSPQMAPVGAFIASRVFRIASPKPASRRSCEGHFAQGSLAGRSVNIRWLPRPGGVLDIDLDALPDFFLVLAGSRHQGTSRGGGSQPWLIASVHLFDAGALVDELRRRGTRITTATPVPQDLWQEAEVYPTQHNPILALSAGQREMLAQFG
jgi:hypothetical protein